MNVLPNRIGFYKPLAQISKGEMATIYQARDVRNQSLVALKVLSTKFAHNPSIADNFAMQALTTQKLRHPGIVAIYDSGFADGFVYMAMEFAEGGTLKEWLLDRNGPPRLDEALAVLEKMADALDYVHENGYLHGNLSSSNILLTNDGRILLSDFRGQHVKENNYARVPVGGMPPAGSDGDGEGIYTDILNFGKIAYLIFTGRELSPTNNNPNELSHYISELPEFLTKTNPFVDPSVATVLQRALQNTPHYRFESAGEFVQVLRGATTVHTTALALYEPKAAPTSKSGGRKKGKAKTALATTTGSNNNTSQSSTPLQSRAAAQKSSALPIWRRPIEGSLLGADRAAADCAALFCGSEYNTQTWLGLSGGEAPTTVAAAVADNSATPPPSLQQV